MFRKSAEELLARAYGMLDNANTLKHLDAESIASSMALSTVASIMIKFDDANYQKPDSEAGKRMYFVYISNTEGDNVTELLVIAECRERAMRSALNYAYEKCDIVKPDLTVDMCTLVEIGDSGIQEIL
jgi:hypothetical protein